MINFIAKYPMTCFDIFVFSLQLQTQIPPRVKTRRTNAANTKTPLNHVHIMMVKVGILNFPRFLQLSIIMQATLLLLLWIKEQIVMIMKTRLIVPQFSHHVSLHQQALQVLSQNIDRQLVDGLVKFSGSQFAESKGDRRHPCRTNHHNYLLDIRHYQRVVSPFQSRHQLSNTVLQNAHLDLQPVTKYTHFQTYQALHPTHTPSWTLTIKRRKMFPQVNKNYLILWKTR